jgi:hypothetical protein
MSATHQQVLQSIKDWHLEGIVVCKQIGGRTSVEYKGEVGVYPHWLALQKVNQIGVEYMPEKPSGN